MYGELLGEVRLYNLLDRFDSDLAAQERRSGCRKCGGTLHSSRYPRKPRGGPRELGAAYCYRASFCCARDGCRTRATPVSLRFLGRKVYLGAVVVLVTALRCGPTPVRMSYLQSRIGVSRRTVMRWRRWWCDVVPTTPFWRAVGDVLMPPVERSLLPASLLDRFAGDAQERLLELLQFLSPITSESATVRAA